MCVPRKWQGSSTPRGFCRRILSNLSDNGKTAGCMPVRESDNLWILSKYGLQRDWINAADEQSVICPVTSVFQRAFVFTTVPTVEGAVISMLRSWNEDRPMCCRTSVVLTPAHSRVTVTIVRHADHLHTLFPSRFEVVDAGCALERLRALQFRFVASVTFCTVRLDDMQHMLFAIDQNMHVVWRGKTVEEDYVHVERTNITDNEATIAVHVRRFAFVFDDMEACVSKRFANRLRLDLLLVFYRRLPVDVIECITHAAARHVTPRDFREGGCESVFTYSVARLLRVACLLGESPLSLYEYHNACEGKKKCIYSLLKRIYRRRHTVFGRQPVSRVLRSGLLC